MKEFDDNALMREYVERDSEEAFALLVARHVNKVYSVALRHTGKPHSAEEITQAVFVILARKARGLGRRVILSGWLYQTARLTAVTFVRAAIRRAHREEEARMQTVVNEKEAEVWPDIAPLLDAGMAGLNETDRHAVVLRYFDGKSLKEVGAALGSNEEAAKKRVNRALEKLRTFFTKRGVRSTTAILAGAISANSVQAAPGALAKSATALTLAKGAAAGGSTLTLVEGALKVMAWTKLKIAALAGVGILLAVGTGLVAIKAMRPAPSAAVVRVASEWKAHFKEKFVIESCVFERRTFSAGNNTELFHFRFQEDAFVMRQIFRPADAGLDHLTDSSMYYAGRWGSNYWAIEHGQVLKLFPDAENLIRENQNPDVSLIDASRGTLLAALYYGMPQLDPATIEWLDETTFTASGIRGGKMRGKILEAVRGLPTVLEWSMDQNPGLQITAEFKYLRKLDLPYYPSEISVRGRVNGKTAPAAVYRILSLKTSPQPMPATWFDPARYYSPSKSVAGPFFVQAPAAAQVIQITERGYSISNGMGGHQAIRGLPFDDGTPRGRTNP